MNLNNIKIIAHRGIHNNIDIPENSLKSFKLSIKKNIPIELDIQLTKDNILVVFHDKNIKRMTNINKKIEDCTYQELLKYNLLNTKEKIPTFKEVLKLVNGKVLLDIEIKNTNKNKELTKILLQELSTYNGEYIIKSFNPKIIHNLKKQNKKIICGLLLSNRFKKSIIKKYIYIKLSIIYSNPNFIAIPKSLIYNKIIKKYSQKNPVFIWTIDNYKDFNKYSQNYTCICNNIPYK